MMALRHIIISAVGSVVFYAGTAAAAPRSQLQQDVEGYAVATCLTGLDDAALKDQGDGWASIIVQRGFGNVEDWQTLVEAVKTATGKTSMAVIKGESISSKPMPVFYCSEIVDEPEVRKVIDETLEKMKPAYDGR